MPDQYYDNERPPYGAEIDYEHPLYQPLIGAWLYNEGGGTKAYSARQEYFSGTIPSENFANATWDGDGVIMGVVGSRISYPQENYQLKTGSLIVRFKQDATEWSLYRDYFIAVLNNIGIYVTNQGGLPAKLYGRAYDNGTGTFKLIDAGLAPVKQWIDAALTWTESGTLYMYVNGVLGGTASLIAPEAQTANGFRHWYNEAAWDFRGPWRIAHAYISDKQIPEPLITAYAKTPYGFVRRPRRSLVPGPSSGGTNYPVTMSGGAIAGGSANSSWAATGNMSGGAVAGGTAGVVWAAAASGSGGEIVGGSATAAWSATWGANGGLVSGGSAGVLWSATYGASGGLIAGGSATGSFAASYPSTGGVVLGGASGVSSSGGATAVMSGGLILGGGSPGSFAASHTPSGGIVLGGSATAAWSVPIAMGGGAVVGGSATASPGYSHTASGGASTGGSAPIAWAATWGASGGCVGGGSAGVLWSATYGMAGGVVTSGSATVTYTPVGGVDATTPAGVFRRTSIARVFHRADIGRVFRRVPSMAAELSYLTLAKTPTEVSEVCFSFENTGPVLAGETLSSPSILGPGGAALSGITAGTPAVLTAAYLDPRRIDPNSGKYVTVPSGQGVKVTISGGTAGTDYLLECKVTTSGGSQIVVAGKMAVRVLS